MFDLHVHTTASDGELNAKEIIQEAKKNGITQLAITDHDTISNVKPCIEEGKKNNVLVIPGVEFSVKYKNGQMHILGYGMNLNNKKLNRVMEELREGRNGRNLEILDVLKSEYGIELTIEEVKAFAKGDTIGRPHFARALLQKEIVESVPEAFKKYLASEKINSLEKKELNSEGAIRLIVESGGIAVLAHPYSLKLDDNEIYDKIKQLKSFGLSGIEAYHSNHSESQAELYRKIAEKEGLIITCGSDYHGKTVKPDIELGKGKNSNLPTSDEKIFKKFYEKLIPEKEL